MDHPAHQTPSGIANSNIRDRASSASVTELEGVILGIVRSRQPCSPYVVLKRFQQSPTWGWSSSTGAIYPAIRRLNDRGLLASEAESSGASARKSELLSLTAKGRSVLEDWIMQLTPQMGSASIDPIRTRVNYLGFVRPEARALFIDRATSVTRSHIKLIERTPHDPNAAENWTLAATTLGLLYELRGRLKWLDHLRTTLEDRSSGEAAESPSAGSPAKS